MQYIYIYLCVFQFFSKDLIYFKLVVIDYINNARAGEIPVMQYSSLCHTNDFSVLVTPTTRFRRLWASSRVKPFGRSFSSFNCGKSKLHCVSSFRQQYLSMRSSGIPGSVFLLVQVLILPTM